MEIITYKGKEYKLRFGWRAQYLFEATRGEDERGHVAVFNPSKLLDVHTMLFCALRATNGEAWTESFEAFIDELDARPAEASSWAHKLLVEMAAWGETLRTGSPDGKKKEGGR